MTKYKFYKIVNIYKKKNIHIKKIIMSFFLGGILGLVSQFIYNFFVYLKMEDKASFFTSLLIIIITTILTLFNKYEKLVQIFGMGLVIPLSGFTNSLISSTIDSRHEGAILGIGSSIFTLAGSVISYGIFFSFIACVIKYISGVIF